MNNLYYPILLNLSNKKVCVIGGGKVACRKIKGLLKTGAEIHVISPEVCDELQELINTNNIIYHKREYERGDLSGCWLVFAATNNPDINNKVFYDSLRERCFCNVVDSSENLGFIIPSTIRRGDLVISISTSGNIPALSRRIRERLEIEFPDDYGIFINFLGDMRDFIKRRFDDPEKRAHLSRLISDETVMNYFLSKKWERLEELIRSKISIEAVSILNNYR